MKKRRDAQVDEASSTVPRTTAEAKDAPYSAGSVGATGVELALAASRFMAGLLKPWESDARGLVSNYSASLANMYTKSQTYQQWHNPKLLLDKYSPEEDKALRIQLGDLFKPQNILGTIAEDMEAFYQQYQENSAVLFNDGDKQYKIEDIVAENGDSDSFKVEGSTPESGENSKKELHEDIELTLNKARDIKFAPLTSIDDVTKKYQEMIKVINETHKQNTNKIKEEQVLAKINDAHAKALETLNNNMYEKIKELHKNAQQERNMLAELHRVYAHNKDMQQAIDKIITEKLRTTVTATGKLPATAITFNDIIKDTGGFKTLTGQKIIQTSNDLKNPSYQIEFPSIFFNSYYYHSVKDNVKADMLALAERIKVGPPACDGIEMTIGNDKSDHNMYMAKKAYEACLEAGYDPAKIEIKIGTQKLSVNDLFPTQLALQNVEDRARLHKTTRETGDLVGREIKSMGEFKDELRAIRDKDVASKEKAVSYSADSTKGLGA